MKYTTVFFIIGLLAVAGMPPLNGFNSKFLIYESAYQVNPILSIIALLGSIVLLAVFIKILYAAFLGPELPGLADVKEAPRSMLLAMGILAAFAVIIGLFPNLFLDALVKPAWSSEGSRHVFSRERERCLEPPSLGPRAVRPLPVVLWDPRVWEKYV